MLIDPRGPRFAAGVTALVLAAVLVTANVWLIAAQTAIFAVGAFVGLQYSPYSVAFRRFVRPRFVPPADREWAAPPRFAQAVGFVFGLVGTVALVAGETTVGLVAVGLAFGAAFLNAAFGFCLGCEMYLLARRVFPVGRTPAVDAAAPTSAPVHVPAPVPVRPTSTTTPEEITA